MRAQTLVSSSSRSLFSESGAQEGQGSGKDEDQGLETPYMALSSEGLPPPMANTGAGLVYSILVSRVHVDKDE